MLSSDNSREMEQKKTTDGPANQSEPPKKEKAKGPMFLDFSKTSASKQATNNGVGITAGGPAGAAGAKVS